MKEAGFKATSSNQSESSSLSKGSSSSSGIGNLNIAAIPVSCASSVKTKTALWNPTGNKKNSLTKESPKKEYPIVLNNHFKSRITFE